MMFEVPLSSKILRFFELIPKNYFPIFTHIIILHILSLVWNALLSLSLPFQILTTFKDTPTSNFQQKAFPGCSLFFLPHDLLHYSVWTY